MIQLLIKIQIMTGCRMQTDTIEWANDGKSVMTYIKNISATVSVYQPIDAIHVCPCHLIRKGGKGEGEGSGESGAGEGGRGAGEGR
jgi:hypothetical protein